MSPLVCDDDPGAHRFPRVSGDEPAAVASYPSMLKFSPRERG